MNKYFSDSESLRQSVASHLARGFSVASQGDNFAIVEKKRKPRILLNLLLSLITSGVWVVVWLYFILTAKRVVRLEVGTAPIDETFQITASNLVEKLKKSRPAQIGAGLVVILIAGGVVNSLQSGPTSPEPSASVSVTSSPQVELPANLGEALGGSSFKPTEALCQQLEAEIARSKSEKLGAKVEKLKKISDPYAAADFLSDYSADYPASISGVREGITLALEAEVELQIQAAGVLDESQLFAVKQRNFSSWIETAFDELGEGCDLIEPISSTVEIEESYLTQITRVSSLRDRKPWFPEGYDSFSTNLAYQFVRGGGCELGDSCWKINVVSKVSCSSMYAELNILDSSGAVIDYSNDIARNVDAMQTVRLEFPTYNSRASTGELTEITCY